MSYTRYSADFKKEAVKYALESDLTSKEIAANLGVKYKTLMSWISASMKKPTTQAKPVDYKSSYQEMSAKYAELQKELKQTKMERDILKKAAAYFASQNM
ncbi:transposase [Facilibium subflavum]|uniref:transposase n=1 Tax=Facilibium subflavum TaxID=2219058 RepID=UPI000E65A93E|nr:transposase [Facilibium subflavum]